MKDSPRKVLRTCTTFARVVDMQTTTAPLNTLSRDLADRHVGEFVAAMRSGDEAAMVRIERATSFYTPAAREYFSGALDAAVRS